MLVVLTGWEGITKFLSTNSSGSQNSLPMASILEDDFDLSELTSKKYQGLTYIKFSNYTSTPLTVKNFGNIVTPYIDRWNARKELCNRSLEQLQSEIRQLKEKQCQLSNMKLKDLMAEYPNCIGNQNKLLIFLL